MEKSLSMYDYVKNNIQNLNDEKIIFENNVISAGKMFEDIDYVSAFLYKQGIRKGDTVGVCLPNIPQAVIAVYAANKLGAAVNAIHPKLKDEALFRSLEEADTKIVFMYDFLIGKHKKRLLENNIKIISCSYGDYAKGFSRFSYKLGKILAGKGVFSYAETLKAKSTTANNSDSGSDAVLLHSSGTFGASKTVRLSSKSFNCLADNIYSTVCTSYGYKLDKDQSMLMVLPIFHGFGLGVCAHFGLSFMKIIMTPFFRPKKIAKIFRKQKVDISAMVPSMFAKLVAEPSFDNKGLANLKLIFSGGDALKNNVKDEFNYLLEKNNSPCVIMEGYGLSELASVVTINTSPKTSVSQGKAMDNIDIKIVNGIKVCQSGEIGEIVIDSPSLMNGYLGKEQAEFIKIEGRNYLRTGDCGYLDEEDFLHFVDRSKRIIIIGGENIYPQEVEKIICGIQGVKDCCIARIFDEKPHTKAYLLLNEGAEFSPKFVSNIENAVEKKLIKYAVPLEFEVVDKLKYNNMGKVDFIYYENMHKIA